MNPNDALERYRNPRMLDACSTAQQPETAPLQRTLVPFILLDSISQMVMPVARLIKKVKALNQCSGIILHAD